jgi:para-nitrobenzyl esterase
MSGPCETPLSPLAGVEVLGDELDAGLGCAGAGDVLACLRGKTAEEVAAVLPPDPAFAFGEGYTVWWPVQDGHILPLQFIDAFESGEFNQVPVINGATRDEAAMLIWISHDMLFKPLQDDQYFARLEYLIGTPELAKRVEAEYPLENFDSAFDALTAVFSDGFFNCLARHQSKALSGHVPTWAYQFDYADAPFFIPFVELGAYHGGEIQYLFGSPASFLQGSFDGDGARLSQSMMQYWAQFARHGNPNSDGRMEWPTYDGRDQTLILDRENSVASGVHESDCRFWDSLPYLRSPYAAPL